jgi:hypothetical protein
VPDENAILLLKHSFLSSLRNKKKSFEILSFYRNELFDNLDLKNGLTLYIYKTFIFGKNNFIERIRIYNLKNGKN